MQRTESTATTVRASAAPTPCQIGKLIASEVANCLCAGKAGCFVEKLIAADTASAVASIVWLEPSHSMHRVQLWYLKAQDEHEFARRLLTSYTGFFYANQAVPTSYAQFAVTNGELEWMPSSDWRNAHPSALTAQARIRVVLDNPLLPYYVDFWSWRKVEVDKHGVPHGVGFGQTCQEHNALHPTSLSSKFDMQRYPHACTGGDAIAIPLLSSISASDWSTVNLDSCALQLQGSAGTLRAIATTSTAFTAGPIPATILLEVKRTGPRWGTIVVESDGVDAVLSGRVAVAPDASLSGTTGGDEARPNVDVIDRNPFTRRVRVRYPAPMTAARVEYRVGNEPVLSNAHGYRTLPPITDFSERVTCDGPDGAPQLRPVAWDEAWINEL
jgi:hypothetical protein